MADGRTPNGMRKYNRIVLLSAPNPEEHGFQTVDPMEIAHHGYTAHGPPRRPASGRTTALRGKRGTACPRPGLVQLGTGICADRGAGPDGTADRSSGR